MFAVVLYLDDAGAVGRYQSHLTRETASAARQAAAVSSPQWSSVKRTAGAGSRYPSCRLRDRCLPSTSQRGRMNERFGDQLSYHGYVHHGDLADSQARQQPFGLPGALSRLGRCPGSGHRVMERCPGRQVRRSPMVSCQLMSCIPGRCLSRGARRVTGCGQRGPSRADSRAHGRGSRGS